MAEENEQLAVMPGAFALMPVMNIQSAKLRYNQFREFVKECMTEGSDYGKVPGTDKDILLKPGAEKLLSLFGLSVRLTCAEKIEDWTGRDHDGEPFFYYRYVCAIYAGLSLVVESEGSCNSREVKYRYRNAERICPACGKATIIKGKAEFGGGWLCFGKKGGCGAKFPNGSTEIEGQIVGKVANPDICDQVNTFQKMAQKRALIGSALIATNASEFFTQDMEDFAPSEHQGFENAKPVGGKTPPDQPISPEDARTNSALIEHFKKEKGAKNGEAFFASVWAKKPLAEREAEAKRLGLITAPAPEVEAETIEPEPAQANDSRTAALAEIAAFRAKSKAYASELTRQLTGLNAVNESDLTDDQLSQLLDGLALYKERAEKK